MATFSVPDLSPDSWNAKKLASFLSGMQERDPGKYVTYVSIMLNNISHYAKVGTVKILL